MIDLALREALGEDLEGAGLRSRQGRGAAAAAGHPHDHHGHEDHEPDEEGYHHRAHPGEAEEGSAGDEAVAIETMHHDGPP